MSQQGFPASGVENYLRLQQQEARIKIEMPRAQSLRVREGRVFSGSRLAPPTCKLRLNAWFVKLLLQNSTRYSKPSTLNHQPEHSCHKAASPSLPWQERGQRRMADYVSQACIDIGSCRQRCVPRKTMVETTILRTFGGTPNRDPCSLWRLIWGLPRDIEVL